MTLDNESQTSLSEFRHIALDIITILGSTQFTLYQLQLLDKAQTTDAIEFKSHFVSLFRMKKCC